jgi:parvulin-like peptidyl-prolyl isomerase
VNNDRAARHATILMAASAALGIAIAGYGLFTAKGTVSRQVPPEDAALVNQRPILMSDFVAQAENTYAVPFAQITREQRQTVLAAMIHEELYVQRGLELDFPSSDPDTRTALVAAVEQQAVADATTELPSDQALQNYFQERQAKYATEGTMTLQNLRLASAPNRSPQDMERSANAAIAALRAGASVAEVMQRFGLVAAQDRGEEFYFAAKIHLGEPLFEAAKSLADGEVGGPISLPDGVHILRMVKNSVPVARDFEHAREQVLGDYKREAAARLRAADEKYLYGKAEIQIAKPLQ